MKNIVKMAKAIDRANRTNRTNRAGSRKGMGSSKASALVAGLMALLFSTAAFAAPECTQEPKNKWKDQKAFQKDLKDQGYKIKVFKVTDGNCYEIYGWNKEGKKVEIYFNPVSGDKVKEEIR